MPTCSLKTRNCDEWCKKAIMVLTFMPIAVIKEASSACEQSARGALARFHFMISIRRVTTCKDILGSVELFVIHLLSIYFSLFYLSIYLLPPRSEAKFVASMGLHGLQQKRNAWRVPRRMFGFVLEGEAQFSEFFWHRR